MERATKELWSRRVIYICGAVAGIGIFGFVLTGVIVEARQLWGEGAAAFFADASLRVAGGALIAILSSTPYVLLARAARQPGPPTFFASICVVTFAVQLLLTINALFLGRTSTAPIGILFIPFYL